MILSLSDTGEGSAGFSYVGSSSISNSVLSRGSTLSTRPSVEGRFSTVIAVNQSLECGCAARVCRRITRGSPTHGGGVVVVLAREWVARGGWIVERLCAHALAAGRGQVGKGAQGAGQAVHGGREGRRWVSQQRARGEGCWKRVWRAEPWRCCWLTRVLAAANPHALVSHAAER
jgi:hypothetical protein